MLQKEMAYKIDDLQTKSQMIHSLQSTLYTAIYCQDVFSKEDCNWAFILLGSMTGEMSEELRELTNCAFENLGMDVQNE